MHDYSRGTYFKEQNHPTVNGKLVLGMAEIAGETQVRLVERKPEGNYEAYWQPKRQLDEEITVGAVENLGEFPADRIESIENSLEAEQEASA